MYGFDGTEHDFMCVHCGRWRVLASLLWACGQDAREASSLRHLRLGLTH